MGWTDNGTDAATLLVVSTNAGDHQSGESIKALQFFAHVIREGYDAWLLTHERNRRNLEGRPFSDRILYVADTRLQVLLFRTRFLAFLLNTVFHLIAARVIRERFPDPGEVLVHYLCPISPVELRLPPRGYRYVIGPLNGNIRYPPAFRAREPWVARIKGVLHEASQLVLGLTTEEKRRAAAILVSGYARTRRSLQLARVPEAVMSEVVDSGLSPGFLERDRHRHRDGGHSFLCLGRLVDFKGFDLAIRALGETREPICLDIAGAGPMRKRWEMLAARLGLGDRVRFLGWVSHDELLSGIDRYRAFVFPSLADANGIAVQEAMAIGLPVICLDWGGPANLVDETCACLVDPAGEAEVVRDIAAAMDRLETAPEEADRLAAAARARAESRFSWAAVAASWMAQYPVPIARRAGVTEDGDSDGAVGAEDPRRA